MNSQLNKIMDKNNKNGIKDFMKSVVRSEVESEAQGVRFMLIILGLGVIFLVSGFKYIYPISIAIILLLFIYFYRIFRLQQKTDKEQDEMISKIFPKDRAKKILKFNKYFRKIIWTIFSVFMIYLMYLLFKVFYIHFRDYS